MKIKIIIFLFLSTSLFAQESHISGKYRNCPFHCVNVTIDSANNFEYRLFGDLYNGEGCFGKLLSLGNNEYLANSNEQPITKVKEYISESDKFSKIIVVYNDSSNVGNLPIFVYCEDTTYHEILSDDGLLKFKKSKIFSIKININPIFEYQLENSKADSIIIQIPNTLGKIYITDEKWLIENENLYFWNEEEKKYNKGFALQKVNGP